MSEISYTVRCSFSENCAPAVTQAWLDWLENGHIQDVINGGAVSGEIIEMNVLESTLGCQRQFEIRYRFPDRTAFETYERESATGLREEGLAKFPLSSGLSYERSVGVSRTIVR